MTKKRTIVEINGNKYDANSGQVIMSSPISSPVIDGFKASPKSKSSKKLKRRTVNYASAVHKTSEKTQKLHSAASKSKSHANHVEAKTEQSEKRASNSTNLQGLSMLGRSAKMQKNAAKLHRSNRITKFSQTRSKDSQAQQTEPEQNIDLPAISSVLPPTTNSKYSKPRKNEDMKSHPLKTKESRKINFKRPKFVSATMVTVFLLAVGGYVGYRNFPNMALRVASQRAGFSASVPGYSPSGFSFNGPVAYSDGVIELGYQSNSDKRNYRLIQRESLWDSQSLLNNFVLPSSSDYMTFQEKGLTVYVYDSSNATWVDSGIWYTVEGNSLLSSEQLLKIADSL